MTPRYRRDGVAPSSPPTDRATDASDGEEEDDARMLEPPALPPAPPRRRGVVVVVVVVVVVALPPARFFPTASAARVGLTPCSTRATASAAAPIRRVRRAGVSNFAPDYERRGRRLARRPRESVVVGRREPRADADAARAVAPGDAEVVRVEDDARGVRVALSRRPARTTTRRARRAVHHRCRCRRCYSKRVGMTLVRSRPTRSRRRRRSRGFRVVAKKFATDIAPNGGAAGRPRRRAASSARRAMRRGASRSGARLARIYPFVPSAFSTKRTPT